jgi:hypothetical protein
MSIARARRLWGRPAVAEALAHPAPSLPRATLSTLCSASSWANTDAELAAWARELPASVFAGVVRLVAGVTRADLLTPPEDRN